MRAPALLAALLFALVSAARAASKLDGRLLVAKNAVASVPRLQGVAAPDPIVRFLVKLAPGARKEALAARHGRLRVGSQVGAVVTGSAPVSVLDELEADGDVLSIEADRKAHPTNDVIRSAATNGALILGALKNGVSDLGTLDGTGVIIGVVDTGIDWTHADFISGGQSRILAIWDQNDGVGPNPSGFSYGSEYLQATLNANLGNASCTAVGGSGCPVRQLDTDGHGTHVAGTAGGNGLSSGGGTYSSLAPKVQYLIVNTDFSNQGIVDAISYIQTKAGATPFIINLSLGENSGPHDGTDSFESAIDAVAASHPVVVAMGNDEEGNPHADTTFSAGGSGSFGITDVGLPVDPFGASKTKQPCLNAEFWHPSGDHYDVTVSVSCSGSCPTPLGPVSTGNSNQVTTNGVTLTILNDQATNGNGDSQVFVQVEDNGDLNCNATGSQIVTNFAVAFTNTQLVSSSHKIDGYTDPALSGTKFNTHIDANGTLTEPASANNVFSIAAYTSRNSWPVSGGPSPFTDSGVSPGAITGFSDHGPTRDNRQKPDISAPGEYVASTKSKDYSPPYPNILSDGLHTIFHGTSQATPAVASALALRLQASPSATVAQLRTSLQSDGRSDADTGGVGNGNYTWGYGKLLAPPLVQSAPGSLAITGVGVSSVAYSWSLVNDATSYSVFYASAATKLAGSVVSPLSISLPLAPNTLSQVQVCGVNGTGEGPCSVSASTVTLPSAIPGLPAYKVAVSTIAVDYSACVAGQCSGYIFQASTDPDFLGPAVYSSATTNTALLHLEFPSGTLTANTRYYLRVGTLNSVLTSSMTALGSTTTATNIVAPGVAAQGAIAAGAITYNWSSGGNPAGTTYTADLSPVSDFSSGVATKSGVDIFTAVYTGLLADTSYYFRVAAALGPYLSSGPVSTLALPPAALASTFSNLTQSALRVSWSAGSDPAGALYQAQISVSPTLAPVLASSITHNTYVDFSGLSPNTTYYAQAQAIANGGTATAFAVLGATSTLAQPLAPAAVSFSAAFSTGFTANFVNASDPPGTLFLAQVSTSVDFGVVAASSQTYNTFATFAGLIPNQTYYLSAAALNNNGVLSSTAAFFNPAAISTVALPSAPAVVSPVGSTQTTTGFFVHWGAGGNARPSAFTAEAASNLLFTGAVSSTTRNLFAGFTGLTTNTSYYIRVKTVNNDSNGPPSPSTLDGFASTLPAPPGVPGQPIVSVTFDSVTVDWNGLPALPPISTCEGYRVQASLDPGFGTLAATADFPYGATQGGVSGLASFTDYFLRVGSIGFDGAANFASLGSTRTLHVAIASATVTGSGAQLSIVPGGSTLQQIQVLVPPGVFPAGTVVSLSPNVAALPPPGSNQANMTAIGTAVAFDLSAGGAQPNGIVNVLLSYDPARLPLGVDEKTIQLARYDPSSGQWTLQSSYVDAADHAVVGQVGHFSLFQPFAVAPAPDLGNVNIFPIPWEPTSDNANFNGPFVTMSNLPANSRVRIFTISGEQVWENTAAASGVITWAGNNNWGRFVGSGTYLVVIDGGGQRVTKRVVIAR